MKPVKSNVGEREIRREKGTSVSPDAERKRARRSPIGCTACLLAADWVLAHAPLATAALNAGHASLFSPAAAATIIFALRRAKSAASFPEPGWMERDFLAAIGKEQQHPQQEKPGREGSGTLPGLLPPRCRAGFLDLRPHRHRAVRGFLPCFLIGFVAALPARRDAA